MSHSYKFLSILKWSIHDSFTFSRVRSFLFIPTIVSAPILAYFCAFPSTVGVSLWTVKYSSSSTVSALWTLLLDIFFLKLSHFLLAAMLLEELFMENGTKAFDIPFDFMARNGIVGYGWPRSSDGTHRPPQYYEFKKKLKIFLYEKIFLFFLFFMFFTIKTRWHSWATIGAGGRLEGKITSIGTLVGISA